MRLATRFSFSLSCFILLLLYDTDKSLASASSLLKLEEGVTYVYNLDGITETSIPKAKGPYGESVKVNIKATVEVSALPQSKALIKLKNVQVTDPDAKKRGGFAEIERHPLLVTFTGSKLEDTVYTVKDDHLTSLNIKRAVASLFQVSIEEDGSYGYEIDILGNCPTNFRISRDGDVTVVNKYRNLNKCQHREKFMSRWFTADHIHASHESQTTPLLESDFEIEQRFKDGILTSAVAQENYLFKPFSNKENGARTKIFTQFTFQSKSNAAVPAHNNDQKDSILYPRHYDGPRGSGSNKKAGLLAQLHKVADIPDNAVPTSAAQDFGFLVHFVHHSTKEDLISVYGEAKSGAGFKNRDLAKKVFLDALYQSKTANAISAAAELLKSNEIDSNLARVWYLSFAFVRHVPAWALTDVTELLNQPKLPKEAYLGIGAYAGQFCREHSCESVPELDKLISKFLSFIGNSVTRDKENTVLAALKGLRNIRHINDEAGNKLAQIIKDPKISTRVRVAALETAQGDPCQSKVKNAALDVLFNREEDSEIRIKAYLALVECPCSKIANKISELLETETVNQVGTFITSHLYNLRNSVNLDKQILREVYKNVKSKRKFPIDHRKFSHNHEFSYNIDALSASAALESNVIYSQKSYLPRSVNLNLTTEIFGKAVNLFEVNGRAENLERVIERYLGPKGYFRTRKPEELLKEGKSEYVNLEKRIKEKYSNLVRNKRSVTRQQSDAFASKVKINNAELDDNIDVDLSLKLLGNEILWLHCDDSKAPLTVTSLIDKIAALFERGKADVKNYNKDFKNHYQFLDSDLDYPTALGITLRLSSFGSAVIHFKLGGSLDVSSLLRDPKNGEFKFEIIPSAAIHITGELTTDILGVEPGVKLQTTLHTSTGSEVHVKLLDGHGFDVNIGLPVKNSDILTVETKVFVSVRREATDPVSDDYPMEFQLPRRDYHGCFDQLQSIIGLTFCGDVGFPFDQQPLTSNAALFPLNGPSKLSLRLDKDDESLKTYHFKFYFNIDDPKNKRLEIKIDTPGSKFEREISFLASVVTDPNKAAEIRFISPIYRFSIEGKVVDTDSEYSLVGSINLDDTMQYKARVGMLINGPTYTPVLEYTPFGGNEVIVKVQGTITVDKSPDSAYRKYTFNNLKILVPSSTYTLDGSIVKDRNLLQVDGTFGYDQQNVAIKAKFQRQGTSPNIKINAQIQPSQFPDASISIKYEYQRDASHIENSLILVHGPDLNSKNHRLTIFQQLHYKVESPTSFDISTKNTIAYPLFEIEGKFEGAVTKRSVSYDFEVLYGKHKVKSKLNAKTAISKFGDYEIDFQVLAFEREAVLEFKREITDANKSRFTNTIDLKPGGKYELNADVTHQLRNNDINGRIVAVIKVDGVTNDYKVDVGLISNPTVFDSHNKILVGEKEYFVAALKYARVGPPSGGFRFIIWNVIESNGDYSYKEGKGTGVVVINVVPLKRKIKGSADLTVVGSKHTGLIEILYDADKDVSKKLIIETDTDLTKSSINSKNKLKLLEKQLQVNFHGDYHGRTTNGGAKGGFEITLPSGKIYLGNLKQSLQIVPAESNGEFYVELGAREKAGDPVYKIFLDTFARNVDIKRYSADTKFQVGYDCRAGNIKFSQSFKSEPKDGKVVLGFESLLSGNLVSKTYQTNTHVVLGRNEISYVTSVKLAEYNLDSKGKLLTDFRRLGLEHETYVETPLEYFKNFKVVHLLHLVEVEETKARQVKLVEEIVWNDRDYKAEVDGELHIRKGNLKGKFTMPSETKPYVLDITYKHDVVNDLRKGELTLTGTCPGDQSLTINLKSDYNKDLSVVNNQLSGQTPYKNVESFDLQVSYKRLAALSRLTDWKLSVNNEKLEGSVKIDVTPNHPIVDLVLITPAGRNRIFYKHDRKSDRQGNSEIQIIVPQNNIAIIATSKVDFTSYENFLINLNVESDYSKPSDASKANKFKLELGNKPVKSGAANKINFSATKADKKLFSGSVTYAYKETAVGFTVEGKGNVETESGKNPVTYKALYKKYTTSVDKETGNGLSLNVDYKKGTYALDTKLTDKEFKYFSKLCEAANCFKMDAYSIYYLDPLELKHDAALIFENKLRGRDDQFNWFSKTHRKGLIVDYETGTKIRNREYNLKSYIHEDEGAFIINLPTREIAAIATYDIPFYGKNKNSNNLKVKFDGSFYLDKKKNPSEKANLLIVGDLTSAQKLVSVNGEAKFSHPSLQNDLSIKTRGAIGLEKRLIDATVDLDVFNKKNNKITASLKVDLEQNKNGHNVTGKLDFISKGLVLDLGANGHIFGSKDGFSSGAFIYYVDANNLKKDIGAFVEVLPSHVFAVVKVPNKELVKVDSKVQLSRDHQLVEGELTLVEQKTFVGKVELIGLNILKASVYRKDTPNDVLQGILGVSAQQIEVRAEKLSAGGAKDNLFSVILKLDDAKSLKPIYELNSEQIKKILDCVKKDANELSGQFEKLLKDLFSELVKEVNALIDTLKKAQPNLKPLIQKYQNQFEAVIRELEQDPEFKKLSDAVRKIFAGLLETLRQQIQAFIALYEKLQKEGIDLQEQLIAAYKKILPGLEAEFKRFVEGADVFFGHLMGYLVELSKHILELLKEHEADIRQLIVNLSENLQDVTKVTLRTVTRLRLEIEEFFRVLIDEIKALPLYSMLKERYQEILEYELPPQFWSFYSEVAFAVDDFLPTPELKDLAKNVFEYIEKRLRRQEVNDIVILRGISEKAYKAFLSVLELLKEQYVIEDPSSWFGVNIKLPIPSFFYKIPQIGSLGDCSLVRYLKSFKELPSITDYYYTYRPTLNPLDYVPPFKAYGLILNSHHFFTFDRKHFAFKGSCSYILAQDFQDGNFSIIANLDNGKLKSITVNDKLDSVDILSDNTVSLNGKLGDYPIKHNDFSGWRRYGSVNLKHKAGVFITRYIKQDIYIIRVSGFYFGRTRGLLGTINNEQYDEFTLPNGHIAKDAAEFGIAYKVTDSCANVPDLKNTGTHAPECNKFFTSDSSLRSSFPYINPDIYREACDQHVAMTLTDKPKAACEIVAAYVTALKQEHVPFASLPPECAKCMVEGKPIELGYSATIESPKGKADVVLVFEQSSHNSPVFKELVTPLITTLQHDLKEKGLSDVEFALIGFDGPNQDWPAHYGNNGKVTFEGKADNIVFGDKERLKGPYDTWIKKLKYLLRVVEIELGNEQIVIAMNEANIYPFRQGAVKIIVLINSTPCSKSPLFPISLQIPRIFNIRKHYRDHGLNFHIISPLPDLAIPEKAGQKLKNVVGFDSERIYTLADAGKKEIEGNPADRPNLTYEEDLCLAFSQYYGGAAFSSQNFVDSKPDQKKKFVEVVSQRIVKGAVAYKYTEDCTCSLYHGLFSYPECKVSDKELVRN